MFSLSILLIVTGLLAFVLGFLLYVDQPDVLKTVGVVVGRIGACVGVLGAFILNISIIAWVAMAVINSF